MHIIGCDISMSNDSDGIILERGEAENVVFFFKDSAETDVIEFVFLTFSNFVIDHECKHICLD